MAPKSSVTNPIAWSETIYAIGLYPFVLQYAMRNAILRIGRLSGIRGQMLWPPRVVYDLTEKKLLYYTGT